MKSMYNYRNVFVIVCMLMSFASIAQHSQLTWAEVAPGVWKGVAGKPEDYDLLKASGSIPNKEALSKIIAAVFPLSKNDIVATISDGKTNFPGSG